MLIELGGYTSNSRLGILTYKPARVQLSYLGYFAPTYLKSIDGWIGDAELFAGLNKCQKDAHSLHYIDGGYMCYDEFDIGNISNMAKEHLILAALITHESYQVIQLKYLRRY